MPMPMKKTIPYTRGIFSFTFSKSWFLFSLEIHIILDVAILFNDFDNNF